MRYAKVDANQKAIVGALRAAGASVQSLAAIGKGCPDLVAAKGAQTWLIECKNVAGKNKLSPDQIEWIKNWRGVVHIVRTEAEALQLIGVVK